MSMIRYGTVLGVCLALAACGGSEEKADADAAAEAPQAPAAPAAPAPPSGPAPVEGYDWSMHDPVEAAPDQASLMYSVAGTDDIPLLFNCDRGSGRIEANTDSPVTGVGAIILGSGEARAMYRVTSQTPSDLSGGEYLTTIIPLSDGPLQAFRETGWINLSVAGQARDLAAHPGAGREAITRFFSFCAPAPAPPSEATPG